MNTGSKDLVLVQFHLVRRARECNRLVRRFDNWFERSMNDLRDRQGFNKHESISTDPILCEERSELWLNGKERPSARDRLQSLLILGIGQNMVSTLDDDDAE